jgi:hypothetical protein
MMQRHKALYFIGAWLYSGAVSAPGWRLGQRGERGVGVPEFEQRPVEREQQRRLSARSPSKSETAFLRESVCTEGKRSHAPSLQGGLRNGPAGKISTGAGDK